MRRTLLLIGLILSILLILGFIAPKQYELVHATKIAAPKVDVYPFLNTLQMMHQWSGIVPQSEEVVFTYGGTAGTVGSEVHWKQMTKSNEGRETIAKVIPLERIETTIRYIRPWESLNHSVFYISGEADTSVVQWHYHGHSPFPFNIRHLFVDMEARLGPGQQAALNRLKQLAEIEYAEQKLEISLDTIERRTLVCLDTIDQLTSHTLLDFDQAKKLSAMGSIESDDMHYAVRALPTAGHSLKLSLPVDTPIDALKADTSHNQKGITAWHKGGYSNLQTSKALLDHYLELKNQPIANHTYSYELVRHAHNEEDSTKWRTAIYVTKEDAPKE